MKKFSPRNVKVNCPGCPNRIPDFKFPKFQFTPPKQEDSRKVTVVDTAQYRHKFGDTKQDSLF